MKTNIEMAREAGFFQDNGDGQGVWLANDQELKAFAALVRDDERRKGPQILGDGEMELTLMQEHQGAVYGVRRRFSAIEVLYGPDEIVEMAAEQMKVEMRRSIKKARGEKP